MIVSGKLDGGANPVAVELNIDMKKSIDGKVKFWDVDLQGGTSTIEISLDSDPVFTSGTTDDPFTFEFTQQASVIQMRLSNGGSTKFGYSDE